MIKLCSHHLSLKTVKVIETSTQNVKEISGSPEIKGVRGTDKRKYVIDMMRVFPRDFNYKDKS